MGKAIRREGVYVSHENEGCNMYGSAESGVRGQVTRG